MVKKNPESNLKCKTRYVLIQEKSLLWKEAASFIIDFYMTLNVDIYLTKRLIVDYILLNQDD